jgi:hypothetical protein
MHTRVHDEIPPNDARVGVQRLLLGDDFRRAEWLSWDDPPAAPLGRL